MCRASVLSPLRGQPFQRGSHLSTSGIHSVYRFRIMRTRREPPCYWTMCSNDSSKERLSASWPASVLAADHRPAPHRPLVHTDRSNASTPTNCCSPLLVGPDDSCRHRPELRPSTPPTANWKTNSRSAINPFTPNSSTSNWPSPLRWSVIPPDASLPWSAPCGRLVAPALARLPRQVSRRQPSRGFRNIGRELRSTWAAPLPGLALAILDQEHIRRSPTCCCPRTATLEERACWARGSIRLVHLPGEVWVAWTAACHAPEIARGYHQPAAASSSCAQARRQRPG